MPCPYEKPTLILPSIYLTPRQRRGVEQEGSTVNPKGFSGTGILQDRS